MADKDGDGPSLELPSFDFRRKLRPSASDPEPETDVRPRPKRGLRLPTVTPMAGALLTGALVGVLAVGLTWLLLRFCELVKGTSSCGKPGLLLLALVVLALGLLGSSLLRAFGIEHAGSISALAVGLLAVAVLLFLVDVLFAWWMIPVLPPVSMAAYALAQAITAAAD